MTSEFYKVSRNRLVQQVLTKAKYDMQWVKDQSVTVANLTSSYQPDYEEEWPSLLERSPP